MSKLPYFFPMDSSYNKPNNSATQEPKWFKTHPAFIMLYFTLAGITVLFLVLSIAYLISKPNWHWTAKLPFPKAFILSSVFLAASSFTFHQSLKAYTAQNVRLFNNMLLATLFCCISFIIGQLFGWRFLMGKGVHLAGKPDGSYLYLMSGLHLAHLLVGLVILAGFTFYARQQLFASQNLATNAYFNNAKNYRRLRLTAHYWHFVDILWLYLLLFFLINHS